MAKAYENNIMEDIWTVIKASFVISGLFLLDKIYILSTNIISITWPEFSEYLKDISSLVKFVTVLMVFAVTSFKLRKEIKNRK